MRDISETYVESLGLVPPTSEPAKHEGARRTDSREKSGATPHLRDSVLLSIEHLEPGTAVVLCAEPGMGKTDVLTRATMMLGAQGARVRYADFAGMAFDEARQALSELVRWGCKQRKARRAVMLACDNVEAEDEADADELVRVLRRALSAGCMAALAMLPESEFVAERLGEATCYWSCDLRIADAQVPDLEGTVAITQGIPRLVAALGKLEGASRATPLTDPSFQEPYTQVVAASVRPGMMVDEQRLRACLLLLGSGTCDDVRALGMRADDELWHGLARDAPLFGVDVVGGTFGCAGMRGTDGINVAYRVLCDMVEEWPDVPARVARFLAAKGDFARAALVSTMCVDPVERCAIALDFAGDFLNVGEAAVVTEAVSAVREEGMLGLEGYYEASCLLAALGLDKATGLGDMRGELRRKTRHSRQARLALRCRAIMRGEGLRGDVTPTPGDDDLTWALAEHAHVLLLLVRGRVYEAYTYLLDSSARLGDNTVATALVHMDYLFCSLLAGIAPSRADLETYSRLREVLERAGYTGLLGLYDMTLPMGGLLMGRRGGTGAFEIPMQRASRRGDTLLRAVFLVMAAVDDLRARTYTRAHVRLGQAMGAFDAMGAEALAKMAHLLDIGVLLHLGERITRPEVLACRGVTKALDRVTTIVAAALSSRQQRPVGSGRWGSVECPNDVLWVVNVLSEDCGGFSARFRQVMPPVWNDTLIRALSEVGSVVDADGGTSRREVAPAVPAASAASFAGAGQASKDVPSAEVEVSLLGGFELRVRGEPVQGKRLERRRAKALLSLLAAVPGHAIKRYVIIESVWPTYDYNTATRCVYSATSVLRAELGALLGHDGDLSLVLSNKAEGTVSLDTSHVGCDVDRFETKARAMLDHEGDDRMVVSLCREVEELYRGDLFVPPTDGAGVMAARARDLRDLYADAMVAGSTAAMGLRMDSTACRFAHKAYAVDLVREDTLYALVRALCTAGRHVEAEHTYEEFVGRVIDATRRPPSRHLREIVAELMGQAERAASVPRVASGLAYAANVQIVRGGATEAPGQLALEV